MPVTPDENLFTPGSGCDAPSPHADQKLGAMLQRIKALTDEVGAGRNANAAGRAAREVPIAEVFLPIEPESFTAAGLTETIVESLVLKFLLARGDGTGREIADQIKLPFILVDQLLREMKSDQLVVHKGAAAMNDFQYHLSDMGRERARRHTEQCTYFGAAPVSLCDYSASVAAQTLAGQHPKAERLEAAFSDLLLSRQMLDRLGPAINSGRGLFLFGAPGNGKTSIAERVTLAFGQDIWIPRAIGVDGHVIRLFDPASHEELPLEACCGVYNRRKIDKRWVRIRRPTLVVGGELTLASLEVTLNTTTGVCEAPLQMKSNCGSLVIDNFGRQRVKIDELLNRWILPLEKHCDYLSLPNGKRIEVPFDQLVIFSTNLEPRKLVDEAFLRRIPYKIEVVDPTEDEFRAVQARRRAVGLPLSPRPDRAADCAALSADGAAFSLLPSPRPLASGAEFLRLQGPAHGDHRRPSRPGGGQLLRGDVGRQPDRRRLPAGLLDAEGQFLLRVLAAVRRQLLEQQAGLNVRVVLILVAGILAVRAVDVVVEDLANRHAGINPHRLHGKHLQRPIAAEADVAEARRYVDEQPQPTDRRAPFDHRHQAAGLRALDGAAQVEEVRVEHEPLVGNGDPPHAVRPPHVQHHLFVQHQLVVQGEVVAVRVQSCRVERVDDDVLAQLALDLVAGEDHGCTPQSDSEVSSSTPIRGQIDDSGQTSHFGFRARQTRRPCWIIR